MRSYKFSESCPDWTCAISQIRHPPPSSYLEHLSKTTILGPGFLPLPEKLATFQTPPPKKKPGFPSCLTKKMTCEFLGFSKPLRGDGRKSRKLCQLRAASSYPGTNSLGGRNAVGWKETGTTRWWQLKYILEFSYPTLGR